VSRGTFRYPSTHSPTPRLPHSPSPPTTLAIHTGWVCLRGGGWAPLLSEDGDEEALPAAAGLALPSSILPSRRGKGKKGGAGRDEDEDSGLLKGQQARGVEFIRLLTEAESEDFLRRQGSVEDGDADDTYGGVEGGKEEQEGGVKRIAVVRIQSAVASGGAGPSALPVTCPAKKRFCDPFPIFHTDYLLFHAYDIDIFLDSPGIATSTVEHLNGLKKAQPKYDDADQPEGEEEGDALPSHAPTAKSVTPVPTPFPTTLSPTSESTAIATPNPELSPTSAATMIATNAEALSSDHRMLKTNEGSIGKLPFPGEPGGISPAPTLQPTVDFFDFDQGAAFDALLEVRHINPAFTQFEVGFRYAFLGITIAILTIACRRYCRLSMKMWGYQQQWVVLLLCLLPLYDGPLSAAQIYSVDDATIHSRADVSKSLAAARLLTSANVFCTTIFLAALMIYFLCIFEEMGAKRSPGPTRKMALRNKRWWSNLLKLGLVGAFWSVLFVAFLRLRHQQDLDPSFTLFSEDGRLNFQTEIRALIALFLVYAVWLFLMIADAARILVDLSPPFVLVAVATIATIALVTAGPFVGAFYSVPDDSATFLLFFGAINLYVYFMAFSYMPVLQTVSQDEDADQALGIELSTGSAFAFDEEETMQGGFP